MIAYGRAGRRAARALDQRQLRERDRWRWPRRAAGGWRRSRWSATTVAGSPPRGSPTTSIVTRSQHIPRIQEAQASAYHALRELVERSADGRRRRAGRGEPPRVGVRVRGDRAGRRLPSLRLPARRRARSRRLGAATTRAGSARGRGRAPRRSSASSRACARRRRRWPRSSGVARRTGRRRASATSRSARATRGGAAGRARLAGHRDLRRLPRRALRPRPTAATATRSSTAPTAARASRSCAASPTTGR